LERALSRAAENVEIAVSRVEKRFGQAEAAKKAGLQGVKGLLIFQS